MSNSKKTVKSEFSDMYGDGKNLNVGKNKTTNKLLNNIPNTNLNTNEITRNNIENSRDNIGNTSSVNMGSRKNRESSFNSKNTDSETEKMLERKESLSLPAVGLPNSVSSSISPFRTIYIALIVIIILIIGLLFFYRDMFVHFFENIFKPKDNEHNINSAKAANAAASTSQNTSAKVDNTSKKVDNTAAKVDVTSAKVESTSAKIDDLDKKVDKLINKNTCSSGSSGSSGPGISTLNNKLNNISPYKEANVTSDGFCYIGYDNGQRECVDVYAGDVCMSGEIFPSLDICINPKLRP